MTHTDRGSNYDKQMDTAREIFRTYDTEKIPPIAGADISARIPAFTFFPVILQFWEGDDEFAPKVKILWDADTMRFLRFETTYYLQGDLLERLSWKQ